MSGETQTPDGSYSYWTCQPPFEVTWKTIPRYRAWLVEKRDTAAAGRRDFDAWSIQRSIDDIDEHVAFFEAVARGECAAGLRGGIYYDGGPHQIGTRFDCEGCQEHRDLGGWVDESGVHYPESVYSDRCICGEEDGHG